MNSSSIRCPTHPVQASGDRLHIPGDQASGDWSLKSGTEKTQQLNFSGAEPRWAPRWAPAHWPPIDSNRLGAHTAMCAGGVLVLLAILLLSLLFTSATEGVKMFMRLGVVCVFSAP